MLSLLPKSSSEDSANCLLTSPWSFTSGEASSAPHPPQPWAFEREVRENIAYTTGLARWYRQHQTSIISCIPHNTMGKVQLFCSFKQQESKAQRVTESAQHYKTSWSWAGSSHRWLRPRYIYSSGVSGKISSQIVSRLRQHPNLLHQWGNESPDWWLCKDAHFEGSTRMTMQDSSPPAQCLPQLKPCVLTLGLCRLAELKSYDRSLLLLIFSADLCHSDSEVPHFQSGEKRP